MYRGRLIDSRGAADQRNLSQVTGDKSYLSGRLGNSSAAVQHLINSFEKRASRYKCCRMALKWFFCRKRTNDR